MVKLIFVGITCRVNPKHIEPRQNGHHLADNIFKIILVNKNGYILIQILLIFVPKEPINILSASIHTMAS